MNILEVLAPRFRIPTKLGFHIPLENSEEQGKNRNKFLIRWGYLPEYLDYMEVDSDDESACCRCRQYHPSFDNDTFDFGKALRLPLSEEEGFSFAPQPIQEDTEIASMIAEVKPANCLFEDLKGKNSDCSTEISDGFSFASGIDFDKSDNVSILGGEIYKYHIEMHGYSWSDFFW
ncbi:unnamed protein product [Allacma fusca]|uniref:Uncharacterized protein n=1 Tax=Allacma fusca TaxID=39272 RepID=A0A8J2NXK2_9HEXA|nr:unnamed protein product [Allacma fusca]